VVEQITFVLSRSRLIVRSATAVIGAASVACRRARTTYPVHLLRVMTTHASMRNP
jgi:hypothetical protein